MLNSRYHGPINEKTGASLIIVCADEYREHANYLQQLISQDDPKFSGTTGVTSAIYLAKEYSANRPKLSSHQYLLFIGPSDEAKKQKETIPDKYHDHCLHYGWLGKTGIMYVDEDFKDVKTIDHEDVKIDLVVHFPIRVLSFLSWCFLSSEERNKLSSEKRNKRSYRCLIKTFYENGLKSFMKLKLPDCPETV